ncbi:unnamed protein product [Enterobius vermicularis]|uniref:Protein kinase domain-containing protein n=1 Tax=Enterobius vermicularis TaxID=51028 RepID=A0A0N4V519_ENTVE|nr:unnamed protein product [Enterobius vermicularis]
MLCYKIGRKYDPRSALALQSFQPFPPPAPSIPPMSFWQYSCSEQTSTVKSEKPSMHTVPCLTTSTALKKRRKKVLKSGTYPVSKNKPQLYVDYAEIIDKEVGEIEKESEEAGGADRAEKRNLRAFLVPRIRQMLKSKKIRMFKKRMRHLSYSGEVGIVPHPVQYAEINNLVEKTELEKGAKRAPVPPPVAELLRAEKERRSKIQHSVSYYSGMKTIERSMPYVEVDEFFEDMRTTGKVAPTVPSISALFLAKEKRRLEKMSRPASYCNMARSLMSPHAEIVEEQQKENEKKGNISVPPVRRILHVGEKKKLQKNSHFENYTGSMSKFKLSLPHTGSGVKEREEKSEKHIEKTIPSQIKGFLQTVQKQKTREADLLSTSTDKDKSTKGVESLTDARKPVPPPIDKLFIAKRRRRLAKLRYQKSFPFVFDCSTDVPFYTEVSACEGVEEMDQKEHTAAASDKPSVFRNAHEKRRITDMKRWVFSLRKPKSVSPITEAINITDEAVNALSGSVKDTETEEG